jgi:predicted double-glycine peptidase
MTKTKKIPIPKNAIKVHLPDTNQLEDYSCGAAALFAIFEYYSVGPDNEYIIVNKLKMDKRVGSHPDQIKRLAKKYGLHTKEFKGNVNNLISWLDKKIPVMLMLQAWGFYKPKIKNYRKEWKDGHWVTAIGYDKENIYFEEPSIEKNRGYIPRAKLEERWHDTEHYGKHIDKYALAIWSDMKKRESTVEYAELIE